MCDIQLRAITIHCTDPRAEGGLMIQCLSSLGGVYCAQGQSTDCSVRQSDCFSEFAVGLKPTDGLKCNTKEFSCLLNYTHPVFLCSTDTAYELFRICKALYLCILIYLLMCCVPFWSCREILLQASLLLPSVWLCSEEKACSLPRSSLS